VNQFSEPATDVVLIESMTTEVEVVDVVVAGLPSLENAHGTLDVEASLAPQRGLRMRADARRELSPVGYQHPTGRADFVGTHTGYRAGPAAGSVRNFIPG